MLFESVSIGIVGAGAIGGYYGSLLARAGFDVHLLVRSGADLINANGLMIQSTHGDFEVQGLRAYTDSSQMPTCDIVLISIKSTANHIVPKVLSDITSQLSIVVNLQNGLNYEEELESIFPQMTLIGGLCFICSQKIGPNKIQQTDYGQIRLGFDERYEKELQYIEKVFCSASIDCVIDTNRRLARWKKLIWNIPYNGICTVIRKDTSHIVSSSALEKWAWDLMKEVQWAASSEGWVIEDQFLIQMIKSTRKMRPYKPSMLVDLENQRPLELKYLYENPVDSAKKNSTFMPKTEALFEQLCWLDPGGYDPFSPVISEI